MYLFIFVVIRLSGKRTLKESTPFDLILLLIFSEAIQEALLDQDRSITNSAIIIITLVMIDIGFSYFKLKSEKFDRVVDGVPMILVDKGEIIKENLELARVAKEDILESGREMRGIATMDEIEYAILENNGTITIIPKKKN